jgi:hypothetical protein
LNTCFTVWTGASHCVQFCSCMYLKRKRSFLAYNFPCVDLHWKACILLSENIFVRSISIQFTPYFHSSSSRKTSAGGIIWSIVSQYIALCVFRPSKVLSQYFCFKISRRSCPCALLPQLLTWLSFLNRSIRILSPSSSHFLLILSSTLFATLLIDSFVKKSQLPVPAPVAASRTVTCSYLFLMAACSGLVEVTECDQTESDQTRLYALLESDKALFGIR